MINNITILNSTNLSDLENKINKKIQESEYICEKVEIQQETRNVCGIISWGNLKEGKFIL